MLQLHGKCPLYRRPRPRAGHPAARETLDVPGHCSDCRLAWGGLSAIQLAPGRNGLLHFCSMACRPLNVCLVPHHNAASSTGVPSYRPFLFRASPRQPPLRAVTAAVSSVAAFPDQSLAVAELPWLVLMASLVQEGGTQGGRPSPWLQGSQGCAPVLLGSSLLPRGRCCGLLASARV